MPLKLSKQAVDKVWSGLMDQVKKNLPSLI